MFLVLLARLYSTFHKVFLHYHCTHPSVLTHNPFIVPILISYFCTHPSPIHLHLPLVHEINVNDPLADWGRFHESSCCFFDIRISIPLDAVVVIISSRANYGLSICKLQFLLPRPMCFTDAKRYLHSSFPFSFVRTFQLPTFMVCFG